MKVSDSLTDEEIRWTVALQKAVRDDPTLATAEMTDLEFVQHALIAKGATDKGLTRIRNPLDPQSKVELIANSVTLPDGSVSQLLYTNDLAVGPVSGKIYFTDSSTVVPSRVQTRTWDTMYGAKYDIFCARPTGRLLEYDPVADKVTVLASGFRFSNGLGVAGDESYLIMNETGGFRIWKYHLKGSQKGEMEVIVSKMPGYPDGLSCSPSTGQCFSVMPSSIVPLHKLTAKLPDFMDVLLRHLLLALPRKLAPVSVCVISILLSFSLSEVV